MTELRIEGVSKSFGTFQALEDINLSFSSGGLTTFLGPSGCGKTTLLRIISGLEIPNDGRVILDGKEITFTPTHKRDIGMVFQSLALFPHLNVADNIAYGMRLKGISASERSARVAELLEMMQLPDHEKSSVLQLSGGQRQRIAIARALALNPKLFLLDEPMSALDANLRDDMQIELRRLQQTLGITTVVVTHDQTEAMTLSDQVVVLGENKVQQVGKPDEVYKMPANRFVAEFIGSGNFLEGQMMDAQTAKIAGRTFDVGSTALGVEVGQGVTLLSRPEDLTISIIAHDGHRNTLPATVTFIRDIGYLVEVLMDVNGTEVMAFVPPKDRPQIEVGQSVNVHFTAERCRAFPLGRSND